MARSIPPSPLKRSGSGSALLAVALSTTFGVGVFNTPAHLELPDPIGCVPIPLPDDLPLADFTVAVVTRTAAHPWFGTPGAHPLAFSVNGTEGLVLNLVRGTTYTFTIGTGAQHPFVFTNSMEGGFANTAQVITVTGFPATTGTVSFTPNAGTPNLLYYNCNNHSYMGGVINVSDPVLPIQLSAKALLEGPYDAGTQLMWDSLRVHDLLPTTQPYGAMGYSFTGLSGGTNANAAVFDVTGNDAIVDWVVVELRAAGNSSTIVASHLGLLQRDGDIVDLDGTSPLTWTILTTGYFIALRHRTHLGVMTALPVPLNSSPTTVDFTDPTLTTFGTSALNTAGSKMLLWSGDVTFNGEVKYTNAGSDRAEILTAIGGTVPTNTVTGQYRQEDVNMDGAVKYTGGGSDRASVLSTIGGVIPTNTRVAQLP